MLEKQITNKQDLIKTIQQAKIKKVLGKDINNEEDLNNLIRDAKQLLRSNNEVSLFLITTTAAEKTRQSPRSMHDTGGTGAAGP